MQQKQFFFQKKQLNPIDDLLQQLEQKLKEKPNRQNAIRLSKSLSRCKSIEDVLEQVTANTGNVDGVLCNQLINKFANNWRFVSSLYSLLAKKFVSLMDCFTYSSFIDACGKTGHFNEAQQAFKEAINKKLADTITYNSFIDACGKTGHFNEAQQVFNEAINKRLVDTITYSSFIDTAGRNGQESLAEKIFLERLTDYVKKDSLIINFHSYNATTTRLTLEWLLKHGKAGMYTLIVGKGSHSKTESSPVIEAFDDFCKKHHIEAKINSSNTGRRHFSLPLPVIEKTRERNIQSKLKPFAPSYIPSMFAPSLFTPSKVVQEKSTAPSKVVQEKSTTYNSPRLPN